MSADNRNTVPRWLWTALLAVAALTVIGEFFIHHHSKFGLDGSFAFYGWYTVVCAVAGVVVARVIGALLGRPEHYHE